MRLPISTTGRWRLLEPVPDGLIPPMGRALPGPLWDAARPANGIYTRPASPDPTFRSPFGPGIDGTAIVNGWQVNWTGRARTDRAVWRFPRDPNGRAGWAFRSEMVSWWNPLITEAWIRGSRRGWVDPETAVIDAVVQGRKPAAWALITESMMCGVHAAVIAGDSLLRGRLTCRYDGPSGKVYLGREGTYEDLFDLPALILDYRRHLPGDLADVQIRGIRDVARRRPLDFMSANGELELDEEPLAVQALTWGFPHQVTIGHLLRPGPRIAAGGILRYDDPDRAAIAASTYREVR